jgi:2-dehydro-3-deoxygalactonokinase
MTHLIGVDWGTSSFRAALMSSDGRVLSDISADAGITRVTGASFGEVLDAHVGPWRSAHPDARLMLSGMIGSRNGWVEAPYARAPAGAADLAEALVEIPGNSGAAPILLVPGVDISPEAGAPDVMRGEETQIIGSDAVNVARATVVAPGSHTKWVQVEGGRIAGFRTYMSGEVFHALRSHTILSAFATEQGARDDDAFRSGVQRFADPAAQADLLAEIFSARTLPLTGQMAPESVSDYLSGLVIGAEVRHGLAAGQPAAITLIGSDELTARYDLALQVFDCDCTIEPPGAAARGQFRIAKMAGIV